MLNYTKHQKARQVSNISYQLQAQILQQSEVLELLEKDLKALKLDRIIMLNSSPSSSNNTLQMGYIKLQTISCDQICLFISIIISVL